MLTERRREQLERLYIRVAPLKRLIARRLGTLAEEESRRLPGGEVLWDPGSEYAREVGRIERCQRILAAVDRRLPPVEFLVGQLEEEEEEEEGEVTRESLGHEPDEREVDALMAQAAAEDA